MYMYMLHNRNCLTTLTIFSIGRFYSGDSTNEFKFPKKKKLPILYVFWLLSTATERIFSSIPYSYILFAIFFGFFVNIHSFINSMRQNIAIYAWGFLTLNGTMVLFFVYETTKENPGWKKKYAPLKFLLLILFGSFLLVFLISFYYFIHMRVLCSFLFCLLKIYRLFHVPPHPIKSVFRVPKIYHSCFLLKKLFYNMWFWNNDNTAIW